MALPHFRRRLLRSVLPSIAPLTTTPLLLSDRPSASPRGSSTFCRPAAQHTVVSVSSSPLPSPCLPPAPIVAEAPDRAVPRRPTSPPALRASPCLLALRPLPPPKPPPPSATAGVASPNAMRFVFAIGVRLKRLFQMICASGLAVLYVLTVQQC